MDPRDASSIHHNQFQPPPPQGVMMPMPPRFAFGQHLSNNNVFYMAPPNSIQNPNLGFNSLTPFDAGHVSVTHQPQPQPHLEQHQLQQRNGSPGPVQGVSAASPVATIGTEQAKKKRGRPRKYSPAMEGIALGLDSNTPAVSNAASGGGGTNGACEGNGEQGLSEKKQRGRPRGSGKKQLGVIMGAASAVGGAGFTAHVLVVPAGENIVAKLVDLSQEGPRTICILSANGTVDNVTLRQVTGATHYHEGQYEIISLSGSICDGSQNNTLNLTVTLAGPDGRLVGGSVTRELIASSSIQMVAGSFIADKKQSSTSHSPLPTSAPHMLSFSQPAPPNSSTQHDATSNSAAADDEDDSNGHHQKQNSGFYNYGQPWTGGTLGWT